MVFPITSADDAAMCNEYENRVTLSLIGKSLDEVLKQPTRYPSGRPNLSATSYKITDRAPIVWADAEGPSLDMVRWSWPGHGGRPVYNFRSEGRRFDKGRCLVLASGFFEFTDPAPGEKRKTRWRFTMPEHELFAIAGLMRPGAAGGQDAWTMLTTEPGPDLAPYHKRQVVVLPPDQWAAWLSHEPNEQELLGPSPAGTLVAERYPNVGP